MTKTRHSWTKTPDGYGQRTYYECTCVKCELISCSDGYARERVYRWKGPPELRWAERAPACPPDLATAKAKAAA
jgi:hypothetical protein